MRVTEKQLAVQAARLAARLSHGVVHLRGDLGAGKTTFCRYFVNALSSECVVTSPTYTLVHQYQTEQNTIYHVDLYRINHPDELAPLALGEVQGIMLIEWPQNGGKATPRADVVVLLSHVDEHTRELTITG